MRTQIVKLKEKANQMILNAPTRDQRRAIQSITESLLFAANAYRGFNYVGWGLRGGYEKWVEAGKPEDKSAFMGDQSLIYFY